MSRSARLLAVVGPVLLLLPLVPWSAILAGPRNPTSAERCNGLDDDGDGVVPADELDRDGDGVPICAGDCDDADPDRYPGRPELCDGIDNDCDGLVDADDPDALLPRVDYLCPIGTPAGDPTVGPRTISVSFVGWNFVEGAVTTFDFGYGLDVLSVDVGFERWLTVTLRVAVQSAANFLQLIGPHDVVITMGGCQLTLPQAFDVLHYN